MTLRAIAYEKGGHPSRDTRLSYSVRSGSDPSARTGPDHSM